MSVFLSDSSFDRDVIKVPNIIILDLHNSEKVDISKFNSHLLIIFVKDTKIDFFENSKNFDHKVLLNNILLYSRYPIRIRDIFEKIYNISSGIFNISITNEYLSSKKKSYKEDEIRIYRSIKNPISLKGISFDSISGIRFVQVNEIYEFSEITIIPNFSYSENSIINFQGTKIDKKSYLSSDNILREKKKKKKLISAFQNSFRKKE